MRHIEENANPEESVDDTLQRLLKIRKNGAAHGEDKAPPLMRTIKVSKPVLELIIRRAKPKEPRDHTLSRLLGLQKDDGNVSCLPRLRRQGPLHARGGDAERMRT